MSYPKSELPHCTFPTTTTTKHENLIEIDAISRSLHSGFPTATHVFRVGSSVSVYTSSRTPAFHSSPNNHQPATIQPILCPAQPPSHHRNHRCRRRRRYTQTSLSASACVFSPRRQTNAWASGSKSARHSSLPTENVLVCMCHLHLGSFLCTASLCRFCAKHKVQYP